MDNPFPGMDPYLEQHWGDIHPTLMVYSRNQINRQLPDDLQARVEESVAEPYVLELVDEQPTARHIEIVDSSDSGRIVTVIEFLSPANKVGEEHRSAYLEKQREYLVAGVNFVEIDLVRQGEFIMATPLEHVPAGLRAPYLICIRRANQRSRAELYRAPLRQRLPNIPIPLRPTDKDIVLQIQPLIDDCYRDGRHDRNNYRLDPFPRLKEEDARWVRDVLREKGLR